MHVHLFLDAGDLDVWMLLPMAFAVRHGRRPLFASYAHQWLPSCASSAGDTGKLSCILSIDRCESLHEIPPQIRWMVTDEREFGLKLNRGSEQAALNAAYGELLR